MNQGSRDQVCTKLVWRFVSVSAQLRVARFLLVHDTKTGRMYQINTKCTKWSVLKIFQMAIKYINIFPSKASKIYPNWDFGLKTNHLATLAQLPAPLVLGVGVNLPCGVRRGWPICKCLTCEMRSSQNILLCTFTIIPFLEPILRSWVTTPAL
jgi:hypothetical protein